MTGSSAFVWIAGVAIGIQALAFLLLHVLEPTLAWKSSLITDYVGTDHGSLARVSLATFGVTWVALSMVLRGALPSGAIATVVFALMLLPGLALLYSSTLDARALDPRLAEGPAVIRRILGILRLGLFFSLIVASMQLRSVQGWEDVAPRLTALAVTIFVLLTVTLAVLLRRGWAGLGQRVIFALTYAWVVLVLSGAWRGPP